MGPVARSVEGGHKDEILVIIQTIYFFDEASDTSTEDLKERNISVVDFQMTYLGLRASKQLHAE